MATRKTTTKTSAAVATYAERAADIERLIDLLKGELALHAAQAGAAPSWGQAGDLGKVRSDLTNAYEFISQKKFTAAG